MRVWRGFRLIVCGPEFAPQWLLRFRSGSGKPGQRGVGLGDWVYLGLEMPGRADHGQD